MSAEHIIQIILESEYGGYHDPVARSIIRALADAGLLARPLPTREEIARAIYDALSGQYGDFRTPTDAADAVLALLKGQDE